MNPRRVIPCLLLGEEGLVKTVRFKSPKYVGDPLNAVRIFNEKEADELILLDITATVRSKPPRFELIREVSGECFMPLAYGGGIRSLADMEKIFKCGVEKVVLNTIALEKPELVREAARRFGSQSIVVCVDYRRNFWNRSNARTRHGSRRVNMSELEAVRQLAAEGAGEIILQSVDRDGTRTGYDLERIREVSDSVGVPVVALGGAGSAEDLDRALKSGASAAAAGSLFVLHGKHRAVLISYPGR
ncbi:MAG: imidazole glycerol phosphate synthase subunit HisF [Candidatus Omnitrophica bacterium]|nr:imidazole glycerol phosphate synthase subunit HisF [Candidatus Omnitrophota bacterium]